MTGMRENGRLWPIVFSNLRGLAEFLLLGCSSYSCCLPDLIVDLTQLSVAVNAPICFKEQEIRNVGYVLKLFLAQKCGTFLVRLAYDVQPRSERTILHGH